MSISMPKGGVEELTQSPSGRRYLDDLRVRHRLELLQPNDPQFNKVYGNQIKRQEQTHTKQQDTAKAEWEKKNWVKRKYF